MPHASMEGNEMPTPPTLVGRPPPIEPAEIVMNNPVSHEDMLMENSFHDIVNADDNEQDMYEEINAIPNESANMVSAIIGIVQRHVSEVWSPPRIIAMAPEYNLTPGGAYDIETNDKDGKQWDFDVPEQRNQCIREILAQRPSFLI